MKPRHCYSQPAQPALTRQSCQHHRQRQARPCPTNTSPESLRTRKPLRSLLSRLITRPGSSRTRWALRRCLSQMITRTKRLRTLSSLSRDACHRRSHIQGACAPDGHSGIPIGGQSRCISISVDLVVDSSNRGMPKSESAKNSLSQSKHRTQVTLSDTERLYWSLVRDGALPPGFSEAFSLLDPMIKEAALRTQRNAMSLDNVQPAVLIHQKKQDGKQEQELLKSNTDQFMIAATVKPRRFHARCQSARYDGPAPDTTQKMPSEPDGLCWWQTCYEARRHQ